MEKRVTRSKTAKMQVQMQNSPKPIVKLAVLAMDDDGNILTPQTTPKQDAAMADVGVVDDVEVGVDVSTMSKTQMSKSRRYVTM